MKRTIITLTVVLAALVLAILFGTPKAQTFNSSAAIAAPAPAPMAAPVPARCPTVHEAIETLQRVNRELRSASHDYCGHKESAMKAVHEAADELMAAEKCAQCQ